MLPRTPFPFNVRSSQLRVLKRNLCSAHRVHLNIHTNGYWYVLPVLLTVTALAADDAPWRSKQIAEWSEDDAKQVLADSPWAKTFTPTLKAGQDGGQRSGMGRAGGIGLGGVGLGIPGMGRRGSGYPSGGGYPNGGGYPSGSNGNGDRPSNEPPKVTLRWESAMPVRTAELKTHDDDAPTIDNDHYAIAVYGVPDRMLAGDTIKLQDQLKKQAALKRDGKKDFKPSSVEVIDRANGRVVVYLFPMTNEITKGDRRVEFDATIGRLELTQSFFTEEMVWQGKLEL